MPRSCSRTVWRAVRTAPSLQIALGDFYRYAGRSPEAMAAYREAAQKWAETTPEGLQARNRIVAQHTVDGNITQARAEIDAVLKAAPDNADALLSRATFAFLERKYDDAIADLRTVLRRQKSAEALLLLARSYVGIGDTVVAKDTYRRLIDDYPDNADGAEGTGGAALRPGRHGGGGGDPAPSSLPSSRGMRRPRRHWCRACWRSVTWRPPKPRRGA